ncbi:MAG: glycosyltransferase family 2 protein, partial [Patescibacteria group bacterium]|nr:glycosyltransferase family 2 protein [Patescibacteria group bacterium]
ELPVEIITNKNNDGFAKGNNDAIKLALEQGFEYVALFNMDTAAEPDCVRKMVEAVNLGQGEAGENPPSPARLCPRPLRQAKYVGRVAVAGGPLCQGGEIGAVQARLMLYQDKQKINSLGNVTHFLGFGYSAGNGEKYKSPRPPSKQGVAGAAPPPPYQGGEKEICYPSGAAVLFKAEALKEVGLFDEEFWMYNEDQDLGWRLWLNGWRCVLAPEAVVFHKYEFSRSIKKYYYLDRNRIMAMLKNYHWATLALIAPAFLVMEAGLIYFAAKNGWFYEKMKVYSYFLTWKNWQKIMAERKKAQALRKVPDRKIVKMFSGKIWYQEIGEGRLKIANIVFNVYWKLVRVLIRW